MGAGRTTTIDHCPQGGDQGIFQTMPLGPSCAQDALGAGQSHLLQVGKAAA